MKKLMIGIFALCMAAVVSAEKNYLVMSENFIQVTAQAEKKVVPNEIYLRIVLNEGNYKNRTLSELENELATVLKKSGIDIKKSLKIKDLSSDFTKKFLHKNANVEQEYSLLLNNTETLLHVIKNLDEAGFSDFNVERLEHSDIEVFRSEVRQEAMKKAARKAAELAGAIGQEAGRAIYIQESDMNYYAPRNVMYSRKQSFGAEETAVMPTLEFEPLKLSLSVTVRFEIK
jgi:uncharacterized protein YggE